MNYKQFRKAIIEAKYPAQLYEVFANVGKACHNTISWEEYEDLRKIFSKELPRAQRRAMRDGCGELKQMTSK